MRPGHGWKSAAALRAHERSPLRPAFRFCAIGLGAAVGAGSPTGAAFGQQDFPPCQVTDVEYATTGRLQVQGTLFGAGDGTFPIGPGTVILRFATPSRRSDPTPGAPESRPVELRTYAMKQRVVVVSTALFWTTTVTSDTDTRLTAPAEGVLTDHTLQWQGRAPAMRSDGVMSCDGSLCGAFGAPPRGTSPLHMGPNPIALEPFQFGADLTTFTMRYAFVSETDSPKQRSYVALAGREVRRTCEKRETRGSHDDPTLPTALADP